MLSVYTRHFEKCPHRDDIAWRRCRCPTRSFSSAREVFTRALSGTERQQEQRHTATFFRLRKIGLGSRRNTRGAESGLERLPPIRPIG
jgi:hypothetical protein